MMKKVMEACSPRSKDEEKTQFLSGCMEKGNKINLKFKGLAGIVGKLEIHSAEVWVRKTFMDVISIGSEILIGCTKDEELTLSLKMIENVSLEQVKEILENESFRDSKGDRIPVDIVNDEFVMYGNLPAVLTMHNPSTVLKKDRNKKSKTETY